MLRRRRAPPAPPPSAAAVARGVRGEARGLDARAAWLLLLLRLAAAALVPLADCDEVFNYWEPLHHLLYGFALQTWEYSAAYALRSYLYLVLHVPIVLLTRVAASVLGGDKVSVFFGARAALGALSAACELRMLWSVCDALGTRVACATALLLATSAGMAHASPALLPSSFAMCCLTLAISHWMDALTTSAQSACSLRRSDGRAWAARAYPSAVWWVGVASLVGWPFAALAGAPLALDAIAKLGLRHFARLIIRYGTILIVPTAALDSYFYGRPVASPINMLRYNLNLKGGAQLYGTEPASFYVKNLLLNFGLALPAAIAAVPVLLLLAATKSGRSAGPASKADTARPSRDPPGVAEIADSALGPLNTLLVLSPLYLWVVFFSAIPHKEERFLYPIYPLVALAAAIAIDGTAELVCACFPVDANRRPPRVLRRALHAARAIILVAAVALGLSRSAALCVYYGAPAHVYTRLSRELSRDGFASPGATPINLCVGREWYRFPSSFFLPSPSISLRFVRSGFGGLLPSPFSAPAPTGSRAIHPHFNDRNAEEESAYTPLAECDFLVELLLAEGIGERVMAPYRSNHGSSQQPLQSPLVPIGSTQWSQWGGGVEFLDASRSPSWSRAFFVPSLWEWSESRPQATPFLRKQNVFGEYAIMRRTR